MSKAAGILTRENKTTIAYRRHEGKNPGVVFLHGLRSDMNGTKALALEETCRAEGRAFVCFDLSGHGASSGDFEQGTIGAWRDDAVAVLDALTEGPQILVGSSLGGWLMLLVALARPERVAGLLGLAAAPDFTADLMEKEFTPAQREAMARDGKVMVDDCYGDQPYAITRALIEDGNRHLLLRGPIAIDCPVILIQGQRDPDVPWQTALTLAERIGSDKVRVALIKAAGHRLSEPEEIRLMREQLAVLTGAPTR